MKKGLGQVVLFLVALLICAGTLSAAPAPQDELADGTAPVFVNPNPPALEDNPNPGLESTGMDVAEVQRLVADLPKEASVDQVGLALVQLMPQVLSATNADRGTIGQALSRLRLQENAPQALGLYYEQLPTESFSERLLVLGMLGELRRVEATPFLEAVIWEPLLVSESGPETLSERDYQEMLQVKAIHGLAYLRTSKAYAAVRDVMVNHEAMHVRISAIDAYMWNHGDSPQTARELYKLLPEEMHMFVERPRFHKGMSRSAFAEKLAEWQTRWGKPPTTDPGSETGHGGER